jgi:probable F420-dependent oxidoreductase
MLVETSLHESSWQGVGASAAEAERLGFDGIAAAELSRDAFLTLTLAASTTSRIRLATSVVIAFPRSPMVVAYMSRNLQDLSGGRFVLGLGTQVKGHIERRFSMEWGAPGPRLREYVESLRAIWETWAAGTPLNYQGKFYSFTLMTPEFSPPAPEFGAIPVQIAAVNDFNIQLAGQLCDGLRTHAFATPSYAREVIWPNIEKGAQRSGRSLDSFEMTAGGFIATGESEEEIAAARENARYRIAFYGSTRTYLPVLEHHGWGALNEDLRTLIAQGRWSDLGTVIPDDVLDEFCVSGTYDDIADKAARAWGGIADSIGVEMPQVPLEPGSEREARFLAMIDQMRAIPTSKEARLARLS